MLKSVSAFVAACRREPASAGEPRDPISAGRHRSAMRVTGACWLGLCLAGSDAGAWLLLVPSIVTPPTFLLLNGLAICMFCVGLASAAKGLPTRSVTQLIHDVHHDLPA
jgi:hypothetical protein